MPKKSDIRCVTTRRWIALSTVAAVGVGTFGAAGAHDLRAGLIEGEQQTIAAGPRSSTLDEFQLAASEGGEGVERVAKVAKPGLQETDRGYLADLGLVEGHLQAGIELYEAGEAEMAKTHMKHPGDELYAELAPELEERGAPGFADELEALAVAVEQGEDVARAREAHAAVLSKLEDARAVVADDPAAVLESIACLVRVAADEYDVAIDEAKVVNVHEYQDAWGFVQVARQRAEALAQSRNEQVKAAAEEMLGQLDELEPAFPALVPPDKLETDPSVLHGAAARMEISALKAG